MSAAAAAGGGPGRRRGGGGSPAGRRAAGGRRRRALRSLGSLAGRLLRTWARLAGGRGRRRAAPEDDEGGFRGGGPGGERRRRRPGGAAAAAAAGGSGSGGERPPGAQGLRNHGNTCFMNAVVQCLSNTAPLAEFLALGRYRARGARAEVTHRLAALVRALWTRDYTPQLSAEFKVPAPPSAPVPAASRRALPCPAPRIPTARPAPGTRRHPRLAGPARISRCRPPPASPLSQHPPAPPARITPAPASPAPRALPCPAGRPPAPLPSPASARAAFTAALRCLGRASSQPRPPRGAIRNIVSKHSSQFRGNAQHDALEFLLWLLDRMHEDLGAASPAQQSRVPEEPGEDGSGGAGSSPPATQHPRGQSFVQSHFQAQYRSSLTCPHCLKQSNTFDPFLCISLPIPLRQTRALNVTLVLQCERRRFVRVGLAVPLRGTVAELREMVAREGRVPPEQVILAEVSPRGFLRSLGDAEALAAAGEAAPLYAFQPPPAGRAGCPRSLPASPGAAQPEGQRLSPAAARSSDCLHRGAGGRILLLLCNTAGAGPRLARFGPPLVLREERGVSWEQLQQNILAQLRALLRGEVRAQGTGALFRIRLAGGSAPCAYLSPEDPRPLCHPAVDRALQLSGAGGPPHVKLTVEWDMSTKERLFGNIQEEVVQDAESVQLQQQVHRQQHSCTLDECFQLYTKEEQVPGTLPATRAADTLPAPCPHLAEPPPGASHASWRCRGRLWRWQGGVGEGVGCGMWCPQLAPDDAWRCPHCKVPQQGTVKLSLWTLPDILIIHLKRFRQVAEHRHKLTTLVRFPLRGLDMAPHVAQRGQAGGQLLGRWAPWQPPLCLPPSCPRDYLYDLYAVCNHHGSMQGGHYTAYCCNALDGRWYSYDDSRVEGVQEAEVSTRSAYILFYQRRNAVPAWSAGSSVRGEHPHLPAHLRPDSAQAPRGHGLGHTGHGQCTAGHRAWYTHVQQSQMRVCPARASAVQGVRTEHRCMRARRVAHSTTCSRSPRACARACVRVHPQMRAQLVTAPCSPAAEHPRVPRQQPPAGAGTAGPLAPQPGPASRSPQAPPPPRSRVTGWPAWAAARGTPWPRVPRPRRPLRPAAPRPLPPRRKVRLSSPSPPRRPGEAPASSQLAGFLIAGGFEARPSVRGLQGRSLSVKLSPAGAGAGARPSAVPPRWSFAGKERGRPGGPGELVAYLESGRRPRCTRRSLLPLGAAGESGPGPPPAAAAAAAAGPPKQPGKGREEPGTPRAPRWPLRVPVLRRAASAGAEGSLRLPPKSQSSPGRSGEGAGGLRRPGLPQPEGKAGVPPAPLTPGPAALARSQSSASLPPRPERGLRRSASLGRGTGGPPLPARGPPGATLQRGRQPTGSLRRPAVPESSF
ncbi:hypothetical protein QYF61_017887 [Mycteria americana]|uniref:ubiquitinyl hydrolase 1 n=1 Tax=Mycteria americana TaxID=33587 RepID=A0AAN7RY94_MYCAM|nr:hypothetical protein QYF61_017887 [Mycteria americana]